MTKLGKLWTDSVAYVALLAGAGLSIAGNVANVVRTRGHDVDTLDVVLAVSFPALVVLMVEVFVSARWRGLAWPMQILRWLGTVAIGAVAMRVSWTHLHALMLARGQEKDVAALGPLAIDALAIMATALILAGRGRTEMATVAKRVDEVDILMAKRQARLDSEMATVPAKYFASDEDVKQSEAAFRGETSVTQPMPPEWTAEDEAMLAAFERDMTTLERPVSAPPALARSNEVKPESVPAEAIKYFRAWEATPATERPTAKDAYTMMAACFGKSARSVRRWHDAVRVA